MAVRQRACVLDEGDRLVLDTHQSSYEPYDLNPRRAIKVGPIKVWAHGIEVEHIEGKGWTFYPMHAVLWMDETEVP